MSHINQLKYTTASPHEVKQKIIQFRMNNLEKWWVCFSRNRNSCFICCWGVWEWMNLDFGKIAIMLDVRYLHFEYFVPQPPHPSVSLNLRVQWIVLPWEWDAARMMATITLHPNTYLVRHSSLWGFQFQNVIHACSRYGYNHCTQCSVLYIQTYISYNVATQLKASGTNCWL